MIKSVMVDGSEALKLMVDGKVAWERGGLPAGYQRCAYLESAGTQYIKTGIVPSKTLKIRTIVMMLRAGNSVIWGSRTSGNYESSTDQLYLNRASGQYGDNIFFIYGTYNGNNLRYENTNGINIQYDLISDCSAFSGEATQPLYIFALNNLGAAIAPASCRMYSLQIFDGTHLLADFVPCVRVADNKPGLYDTVTQKFFINAGTGEFQYELA